jgi:hypothetical protein
MRPTHLHWKPVSLESENEAHISICSFRSECSEKIRADGFFGMDTLITEFSNAHPADDALPASIRL